MALMCKKSEEIMKALEQNINDYPKDFYRENAFLIDFHGIKNGEYEIDEKTMEFIKTLEKEYLNNVKDAKLEIECVKVGDSRQPGGARNFKDILAGKNASYYAEWFVYEANLGPYQHSFAMEHKVHDDHPWDEFSSTSDTKRIVDMSDIKTNLKEPELQGKHTFSEFAFPGMNGPKYDELFMPDNAWIEWKIKDNLLVFLQQSILLSDRYEELSKELGERDAITACLVEKENPKMKLNAERWVNVISTNNHVEKEYYERNISNELSEIEMNNDIQGLEELLKNIDRPYMLSDYTKARVEIFAQRLIDGQYMEIANGKFIAINEGQANENIGFDDGLEYEDR